MATIAAIRDFLSQRFELFLLYKSPRCFLPSFESISLSVQKKKGKIDFQDGRHLGFPIGTISAIFISTSHPDPSYQFSNQLALWFRKISEKKSFNMADMTAILDFRAKQFKLFLIYKSPKCFLPSFESNGLSVQEKKRKVGFSRLLSWRPAWIFDRDDFSYFWSTGHLDASYLV